MKYFVESLPRSCFYCDCCHTKEYDSRRKIDGEKFCGIENMEVNYYYDHNLYDNNGRPDWCPLKEIPQELKYGTNCNSLQYADGWNDCVNKMLGD